MNPQVEKIKQTIMRASNVAVIGHQEPDGDALGSTTAMAESLQLLNKKYTIFFATPAATSFDFLPHFNEIITDENVIKNNIFDLIIVMDSGNLKYAGIEDMINSLSYKTTIINIDHHFTNTKYGDFNLVIDHASSTCEIVFKLLEVWHWPININIATSLLNGIMTDTGGLTNPATTDQALMIASKLMNYGANFKKITDYNVRVRKPDLLKLWGLAMKRLIYNKEFKAAITYLTKKDFQELKLDDDKLEGLSNFLSNIKDVNFTLLLTEKDDNTIKGSFRTTKDDVNVAALAKELGGGGHQKAAGFVINGRLEVVNGDIKIT